MPGSKWKQLCALLVSSLVVAWLATPSNADLDCKKTTANRSGGAQGGQLITLIGPAFFTEIANGPFPTVTPLFVPAIATSVLMTGTAIPSTSTANPAATSVCTTGFSVVDHQFFLGGWTWTDLFGNATSPITDPNLEDEVVPGTTMVLATLSETSGSPVDLMNVYFSKTAAATGLSTLEDPPPAFVGAGGSSGSPSSSNGGGGNTGGGVGTLDIDPPGDEGGGGPIIIPPNNPPTTQGTSDFQPPPGELILAKFDHIHLNPNQQMMIPLDVSGGGQATALADPSVPLSQISLVVRFIAFSGGDPVVAIYRDRPFVLYPPLLSRTRLAQDIYITLGGDSGQYAPEQICVQALDTNSGPHTKAPPPTVTLVSVTSNEPAFVASDVIITGQTVSETTEISGRPATQLCVDAQLRLKTQSRFTVRTYDFLFKAVDAEGQVSFLHVIAQVRGLARAMSG